jgi:hypothetical protein
MPGVRRRPSRPKLRPGGPLAAVVRRLRFLVRCAMALDGLGRLMSLTAVLPLALFALDAALRPPVLARCILLLAAAAVLAWRAQRNLARPLLRALPDHALLIEVERRSVARDDLLSSAASFQLAGAGAASPALVLSVVGEADRRAAAITPARLIEWRRPARSAAAGVLCLAALAAAALLRPDLAGTWLARAVLLRPGDWPARTRLVLSPFEGRVLHVLAGADLPVVAVASGHVPRLARLTLREPAGRTVATLEAQRTADSTFKWVIERCSGVRLVSARAGDAVTRPCGLFAVDPPAVSGGFLRVQPPSYVASRPYDLPLNAAEFSVPLGSRAALHLEAARPIAAASWAAGAAEPLPMQLLGPASARCAFPVNADLDCAFHLVDHYGMRPREPFAFRIHAVPDRDPDVLLRVEGVGQTVCPAATIPLHVGATDDYGVVRLAVDCRIEGRAAGPDGEPAEVWAGCSAGPVEASRTLDLRTWDARPGDRLLCRATATDNRALGGPNVAESRPLAFRVITAGQLRAALLIRQGDIRRDLELAVATQSAVLQRVRAGPGEPADLGPAARDQLQLGAEVAAVAARYRAILDEMLYNRLADGPEVRRRLAEIVAPLDGLVADDGLLARAAHSLPVAAQAAAADMADALGRMRRVREFMLLFEGLASVASAVGDIARDQQTVLERTRDSHREVLRALETPP